MKKVVCLLMVVLVLFSFCLYKKSTFVEYSNKIKEVYGEWDSFKSITETEYSDIGALKLWN